MTANRRHRAARSILLRAFAATAVLLGVLAGPVSPAGAAPGEGIYADWTVAGASTAYTGTMTVPAAGFPAATFTSNSRQALLVSGSSTWLSAQTPFGAVFGSSKDEPYLIQRPTTGEAPATTTYTFATPTPANGWGFALGDIDADQVTVSATTTGGAPLTAAQLGFQSSFNYCAPAISPKPAACSGEPGTDVPTWIAGTNSGVLRGNATATDTTGAAGWFRPTVPVETLTLLFTQRSGFPVYQTWFASTDYSVRGTVTLDGATPQAGVTVELQDANGDPVPGVAPAITDADGNYSFSGLVDGVSYRVEMTVPVGFTAVGPITRNFTVAGADVVDQDFDLTSDLGTISGQVSIDGVTPKAGVTVTLTGPGGPYVAVTDADGNYSFADLADGDYTITMTTPDGYTVVGSDVIGPVSISGGNDVADQDFEITVIPQPASGTVTDQTGASVAGVTVAISGAGCSPTSTVTDANGGYQFGNIGIGAACTVILTPPSGDEVGSTNPLDFVQDADGTTGLDFTLDRRYAVTGTVTDQFGSPLAGVPVTLTGADCAGAPTLTDAYGSYAFNPPTDGCLNGVGYSAGITVPAGYTGPSAQAFNVNNADAVVPFQLTLNLSDISGQVTVTGGAPKPGVSMQLLSGAVVVASTTTDASGNYVFPDMPDGNYTVQMTLPEGYQNPSPGLTRDVVLNDADLPDIDFEIEPIPFPVSGTVTDDNGDPVPNVVIQVFAADDSVAGSALTDANGDYQIPNLTDGEAYTVRVTAPPGFVTVGAAERDITISGAPVTGQDFELTHAYTVGGTVTDAGATPIPGAVITLYNPDSTVFATATTAADGTYSFADVPVGLGYRAAITTMPDGWVAAGPASVTFDVAGDVTEVDFTLQQQATTTTTTTSTTVPDSTTTVPTSPTSTTPPNSTYSRPLTIAG